MFGVKAKDITSLNDFVILDIRPFLGTMDDLKVKIGPEIQKENESKIIDATTKTLKVSGETVIQVTRIIRDAQDPSSQGTKDIELYILGHNHIIDILGHNDKELDQILSTFKFTDQNQSLKPADSKTPTAGICGEPSSEEIVTVTFGLDDVPQPRCTKVTSNQKLKIINNSNRVISGTVGQYRISVATNKSQTIDATFGSYLAPGVHEIVGAEIWLQ